MQRDIELSGGPLAGIRWPVRLEADRTLWIGIGADGGEYDGRSRLKAIAIYERAGSEESPRFDFARLEGPGARIAELGRRITRLRTNWAAQRRQVMQPSDIVAQSTGDEPRRVTVEGDTNQKETVRIAGRVFERWLHAVEALALHAAADDEKVRITLIVPGEAEQLRDLLERNDIGAGLVRAAIEVRIAESDGPQTWETGAVEIRATDVERVKHLLLGIVSAAEKV